MQTEALLIRCGENYSGMTVSIVFEIEPKFVAAVIFLPSSCMVTFCELTLYTFHVYRSSKRIIQSEKYKSRFHSERPYNNECETANAVREGENNVQVSLICLTRLFF